MMVPVYIVYGMTPIGDVFFRQEMESLRKEAKKQFLYPIMLVTTPRFNVAYDKCQRMGFKNFFRRLHTSDVDIDEVLFLWVAGNGSSAYIRDAISYAFKHNLEMSCLSPKGSLLERYMQPFLNHQAMENYWRRNNITSDFLLT